MFLMVTAVVGIYAGYVSCFELAETSKNLTRFVNAAQRKMEEIKSSSFGSISSYNGSFIPDYLPDYVSGDSRGFVNVDSTNASLLEVTVSVCWRQRSGRVVGEDRDLDGVIDSGEDVAGDGIIDSPAQLVTKIAQ